MKHYTIELTFEELIELYEALGSKISDLKAGRYTFQPSSKRERKEIAEWIKDLRNIQSKLNKDIDL